jgi:hypothetical protein
MLIAKTKRTDGQRYYKIDLQRNSKEAKDSRP